MGFRDAGKSSAGNTILLQGDTFDKRKTVQCVKRQAEVAGRHVTVVNTPGWEREQRLEVSPELLKEEIVLSTTLCPPGPHAILLVMPVKVKLTETSRMAMQEHLELLGERVWTHSMVLFTCGDWLGDRSIEQHIASEGKIVDWVVDKCGGRYHVLNNVDKVDRSQVSELLLKVEDMVKRNDGQHYEMDRQRLLETEEKRRDYEKRAKERMVRAWQFKGLWNVEKQVEGTHKLKDVPPASEQARPQDAARPSCPATVAIGLDASGTPPLDNTIATELSRTSAPVPKEDQIRDAEHTPSTKANSTAKDFLGSTTTPSTPVDRRRRDTELHQASSVPPATLSVRPTRNRRCPDKYRDYQMF